MMEWLRRLLGSKRVRKVGPPRARPKFRKLRDATNSRRDPAVDEVLAYMDETSSSLPRVALLAETWVDYLHQRRLLDLSPAERADLSREDSIELVIVPPGGKHRGVRGERDT